MVSDLCFPFERIIDAYKKSESVKRKMLNNNMCIQQTSSKMIQKCLILRKYWHN